MRREALALLAILLLASVPAVASPGPSPGQFLPHAPIRILSDANFTAANGVVSGSGTPADPFVIAGWHIQNGQGSAIYVYNTTAHFVIRDNILEGRTGLSIEATASAALVSNNKFQVTAHGVRVINANATIRDNSFIGTQVFAKTGNGVTAWDANVVVQGNSFSGVVHGVVGEGGTYVVTANNFHHVDRGVWLRFAVAGSVDNNTLTVVGFIGIEIANSQHVTVAANVMSTVKAGMVLWVAKDVHAVNNTIQFIAETGVLLEHASGNFSGNVVIDGMGDAVQIWASAMVMANNTIMNNIGIGLHFSMSESNASGNVVVSNGVGIAVYGGSAPHLKANVLVNNTVGFDIAYDSRQTILRLEGNFVNGINVDGKVNAHQKVFFYKAANVSIQGAVIDSGFSAGFYGSLSAQGNVVLYEVDTAWINASVIGHANVGVGVVNSFNVNVANSLILGARVGVKAEAKPAPGQVPPCVIAVKDSNITIPIDPPATVGIDVGACVAFVVRTNISIVDVGVRFSGSARGSITNSTITQTRVGLEVGGSRGEVEVRGNLLAGNRVGAQFYGTAGIVADNRFENNTEAGARLDGGARLRLERNNFSLNAQGLVDARACAGPATCSSVEAEANSFWRNRGDGARIHGATTWRDDVFRENRGFGLKLANDATLRGVVSERNDADGAHVSGRFVIRDSRFDHNEGNGATLRGSGELRGSTFRHNEYAGIHMDALYVTALELNVSFNFDGILFADLGAGAAPPGGLPGLTLPELWRLLPEGQLYGPDPLDIHRSAFVGNTRDAIRAGASVVNATYNYWGTLTGPSLSAADQVGAYRNGVSPYVRFVPYYTDPAMTTTGPVFIL